MALIDEARRYLVRGQGPTVLGPPWMQPPPRSMPVDAIGAYTGILLPTHIDPVVGYTVPAGHYAYIEGVALGTDWFHYQDLNGQIVHPAEFWHTPAARLLVKVNEEPILPGAEGRRQDRRRFRGLVRGLDWKLHFDDITALGQLTYGRLVFAYGAAGPYQAANWDTLANPGLANLLYQATNRPRGSPTSGLTYLAPIRRVLLPGETIKVVLDAEGADPWTGMLFSENLLYNGCLEGWNEVGEILTDGVFENWATPTNLTHWTEQVPTNGGLYQDQVENRCTGASCVRIEKTQVAGATGFVAQSFNLTANTEYRLRVWSKCTPGAIVRVRLRENGGLNRYLQDDLTWAAPGNWFIEADVGAAWVVYEIQFTALVTQAYTVYFETGAPIGTVWFDDASLVPNLLADGEVEFWNTPNDLTHWLEAITGASTVNQDNATVRRGLSSVRFDVVGGGDAQVRQVLVLAAVRRYRYLFYGRTTGIERLRSLIQDSVTGFYWDPVTLTWWAGAVGLPASSVGAWLLFLQEFWSAGANQYVFRCQRYDGGNYSTWADSAFLSPVSYDAQYWNELLVGGGLVWQSLNAHSGEYSAALFLTAAGGDAAQIQSWTWPLFAAGERCRLSFWHYDDASAHVEYRLIKLSGESLQADGTWGGAIHWFAAPHSPGAWAQVTQDFQIAGADNYSVYIRVIHDTGVGEVTCYVDDAYLGRAVGFSLRARLRGWIWPVAAEDYSAAGVGP